MCDGYYSGHSTFYTRPHFRASGVLSSYEDGSNGVDGPMVSVHSMCFEHTCECLGGALHVRQAKISFWPGPCRCNNTAYFQIVRCRKCFEIGDVAV